ncbi:Integral membrane protein [Colletotrichum higginsianum IMI 349063]|uniref:Integral membrane protein n=3 Tax=Colletotrichum higginsianum TaxID=80884 RepID=A0A1B7XWU2_COLHI|nr:Integral membrane protein [Colletotrichum higginsianum IMI 349063]OBR04232.1 Integral membrane protein [Colletotrichum higginsianum IMI 349063]
MEVPPGIDPTDSRGPLLVGVTSFVLSVAFVAVSLRIYVRSCLIRQIGMDDWASIIAFLLVFACGFAVAWNVKNGLGRHVYFLTPEQIKNYMRTFYVTIVFYNAALAGIKMTFLFQYYRVLAVQRMKKVFIAAMIIVGAWSVSQILIAIFNCSPIPAFWDKSIDGSCIPNYPYFYINAAGNIATDIIVFVLPLPVINKLSLARGQKYVLLGIFCLGFFTCTISFIRISFLKLHEDFTWSNVETAGWSVGELCSGLLCACLPTFRPLTSRFIPALASRSAKSSRQRQHDGYSHNTGSTSKHRDLEVGGAPGKPGRYSIPHSKRRTGSTDSKADLYDMTTYDLSHTSSDREGERTTQGPAVIERQDSQGKGSPSPTRRQKPIEMRRFKSHNDAVVETHIEAGPRVSDDKVKLKPGAPIEVTCDIVQISSQKVEERIFT